MTAAVIRADARALPLPAASVDLIVTSPPYFALRDYRDGDGSLTGQIGAEPTPQAYVAALLECTREWVRVLKPSGSLWVNLSDKYSTGDRFDNEFTVEDAAWLGGVIDSDGSISVHINKQPEGRAPSFVPWVRVGQMRREVVDRIGQLTGTGKVWQDGRGVWNWNASAQQARWILERIWPWLFIKRKQALAAIELARHIADRKRKGSWAPLTAEDIRYRQMIRASVLAWNAGEGVEWEPPYIPLPDLPVQPRRIPHKSLMLLPQRYALGCIDDLGLILRAEVIWAKPNGLPESVTDRVRRSHEHWFHFTKEPRYYSAVDEIRQPGAGSHPRGAKAKRDMRRRPEQAPKDLLDAHPLGSLPGSVWEVATEPLRIPAHIAHARCCGGRDADCDKGIDHFAAFPSALPMRIIAGWSPPGICTACGEGRRPVVHRDRLNTRPLLASPAHLAAHEGDDRRSFSRGETTASITGYACACPTPDAHTRPALVVDPFGGTGTTALAARALGRRGISFDLSHDYARLAQWRTTDPGELARVLGNPKPAVPVTGQLDMFGEPA